MEDSAVRPSKGARLFSFQRSAQDRADVRANRIAPDDEALERDVGLPMYAVPGVPVGVAVPPDNDPGHGASVPAAPASTMSRSANGMIGQSFQSLSRA